MTTYCLAGVDWSKAARENVQSGPKCDCYFAKFNSSVLAGLSRPILKKPRLFRFFKKSKNLSFYRFFDYQANFLFFHVKLCKFI